MNRVVSLTDESIASSKFPGDPPPASPNSRTREALTTASIFKAGATLAMRVVAMALCLGAALPAAAQDTQAPSVPADLRGTATSTTINLTWSASTDNVGVTGYYIYLNNVPLGTTTARSFQHTGRTPNTTYNYRVSAYDAVPNHSAWTATPVAVRTLAPSSDTQAPSVPTGLVGRAASSTEVTLTWNASTDNVGVTGYYVYLNDVALGVTTSTSFRHVGRTAGTTYNYRVSAYDAVPNHSAWTATPVSVTTTGTAPPDTTPPSVPAGLAGTAVSASQINLSWSAATDNVGVKGYYIYVNDVALGTTTATSFQHTGRSAGTTYRYRVSAYDAVPNHSAWTATPVAVTTMSPPPDTTPPAVPAGLSATAVSASQINLTWSAATDNVGVKGYYIYVNDVALGTTTATAFQHTGLAAGTTYRYRVSAYDAVPNHSAWTASPVSATTKTQAQPGTVQFFATFKGDPFRNGKGDGMSNDNVWWVEQASWANRANIAYVGRDGGTALRLTTEPGDNNVSGSGSHERNDVALSQAATDGYHGRETWWAHSVLFPWNYVTPPAGHWGTVFDFHDTRNQGGQANFHIFTGSDGRMSFRGQAGPEVVMTSAGNQYSFGADIGPVVKDQWYDFVYHIKWSSGSDGIFQAWVNGVLKLDHRGPTLYNGYGVYLKLANYHSAFGQSTSVIHDRVIRGTTASAVTSGWLEGVQ